jgi:Flp pilus assembly pilin Flp
MKNRPALLAIVLTIIASVILAGMDSLGKGLMREFSTAIQNITIRLTDQ